MDAYAPIVRRSFAQPSARLLEKLDSSADQSESRFQMNGRTPVSGAETLGDGAGQASEASAVVAPASQNQRRDRCLTTAIRQAVRTRGGVVAAQ
jgi:hypothetical protein